MGHLGCPKSDLISQVWLYVLLLQVLFVGGAALPDSSGDASTSRREGLTAWRVLSDNPYYKLLNDPDGDASLVSTKGGSWPSLLWQFCVHVCEGVGGGGWWGGMWYFEIFSSQLSLRNLDYSPWGQHASDKSCTYPRQGGHPTHPNLFLSYPAPSYCTKINQPTDWRSGSAQVELSWNGQCCVPLQNTVCIGIKEDKKCIFGFLLKSLSSVCVCVCVCEVDA
jgi:hypothetical protein